MISGTEETLDGEGAITPPAHTSTGGLQRGGCVGRYVVLDRIGAGGMGVVYAAYDPELDRKVAVKLLRGSVGDRGQALGKLMHRLFGDSPPDAAPGGARGPESERLLREAQAMARVSHPNVITVHDVGEHDGHVFIAMEFVQGRTLGAWLREAPHTWREVVDVMARAGRGLAAAHEQGLVHRDFKPENVMVGIDDRVRVMDFGLVRPAGEEATSHDGLRPTRDALATDLTDSGSLLGTPAYMSPEQHLGTGVDARSDQFSFCVALWEALYRERPFAGDSLASLAANVIDGDRRPTPSGVRLPGHLRRVLERGLAVDRDARYPSMHALLAELDRDPTRRRRNVVLAAALPVAIAGGFGLWRLDRARTLAACDDEGRAIADVWGDEARARVAAGILATDTPYGASTVEKLSPWLDEYADAWATARTEACTTAAFGAGLAESEHAEIRACLDERAETLAELVALFAEADPLVVRKAVPIAAGLPELSRCTDPRWLERRNPLPEDPDARAQVLALRGKMTRAAAMQAAGRHAPALELARGVLVEAEALGLASLAARARYRIGALHEFLGDYAAAEHELVKAMYDAAALGEDGDAADAAMRLAVVVSVRLSRPDEGAVWARWAEVFVARVGEEEELRGARLNGELGIIARERGAFADARARHERAVAIEEALLGDGHPELAMALNNLGTVEVELGDYDGALAHYQRALDIYETTLGPEHPDIAMAVMNRAEVHWSHGDLAQARADIERALAINEAVYGPDHPRVGQSLDNLGLVLQGLGDHEAAVSRHTRALAIFERALGPEHAQLAATLGNLGDAQRELGALAEARRNHERAFAIAQTQLGPDHPELANLLHGIGRDHEAVGDQEQALAHYRRALGLFERAVGAEHPKVGLVLGSVGMTEYALGRNDDAVKTLERALALVDATKAPVEVRADLRFTLARATWELGRERTRARALASEARELRATTEKGTAEIDTWLAEHSLP